MSRCLLNRLLRKGIHHRFQINKSTNLIESGLPTAGLILERLNVEKRFILLSYLDCDHILQWTMSAVCRNREEYRRIYVQKIFRKKNFSVSVDLIVRNADLGRSNFYKISEFPQIKHIASFINNAESSVWCTKCL